jgi:hypothetical protein
MKHLGKWLFASVWLAGIIACVLASKDDAAGMLVITGVFAALVIGAGS